MSSPTARSLKHLRDQGWTLVEKVERFNAYTKRYNDLFGFIDILCLRGDELVAVQTTSDNGGNVSARITKIKLLPAAKFWAASPTRRIIVHGWAKKGERGKRKTYQLREIELTAKDFDQ